MQSTATFEQILDQYKKKQAFNTSSGMIVTSVVVCAGMVAIASVVSPVAVVALKAHLLAKAALGLKIATGGLKIAGICLTTKGAWELVPWPRKDGE